MLTTILTKERIQFALSLLEKQFKLGFKNFNNLEYLIYQKESDKKKSVNDIYDQYVEQLGIYNNHEHFKVKPYYVSTDKISVRKFHFQEHDALVLYSTLGLFLAKLVETTRVNTNSFLKDYRKKIKSYYGASIDLLKVENCNVRYQDDYKKFLEEVRETTKSFFDGNNDFTILKIDIKSFFYSIPHIKLVESIYELCPLVERHKQNITIDTMECVKELLHIFMRSDKGLPVANQNIMSSFLADTYLTSLDSFIYKFMNDITPNWKYIRYVDDIYIFIDPDETFRSNDIISSVSYFLAHNLGLELNAKKTHIWDVYDEDSLNKFLKSAVLQTGKYIDGDDEDDDEDDSDELVFEDNNDKLSIFHRCSLIFHNVLDGTQSDFDIEDFELFNRLFLESYQKDLKEYLVRNPIKLNHMQNYHNLLIASKQLLNFAMNDSGFVNDLKSIVMEELSKKPVDQSALIFIEHFLIRDEVSEDFSNCILKSKDKESSYLLLLKRVFSDFAIEKDIFILPFCFLEKELSLKEQCKLLALSEISKDYKKCLNHLYNILLKVGEITFRHKKGNYNIDSLIKDLGEFNLSTTNMKLLKDLSNARCNNDIAHVAKYNYSFDEDEFIKNKLFISFILKEMEKIYLLVDFSF